MTEYQKWQDLLSAYEKILHPDFFMPLMKQMNAVYEECKRDAYKAAKISDDALWLEDRVNLMKKFIDQNRQFPELQRFSKKNLFRDIIKRFEKV